MAASARRGPVPVPVPAQVPGPVQVQVLEQVPAEFWSSRQ
jgi:hypothetical protein